MIAYMDELYQSIQLNNIPLFRTEYKHLRKMEKLWPPYDIFYFSLICTAAIYYFIRVFLNPLHLWKLIGKEEAPTKISSVFLRIISSGCAATATFLLLLQMERLAELHVLVIVLNFLHTQMIFFITTIVSQLHLPTSGCSEEKSKIE